MRAVAKQAEGAPGRRALELHAGAGLFTVDLARRYERVTAVEVSRAAVRDLRHNLEAAGLGNVRVRAEAAERALERERAGDLAVVLVDPPRTGLSPELVRGLCRVAPARIVYVSCDPATLARDLARLCKPSGAGSYTVAHVEGFDLFPQTPHVEAVVRLERADPVGVGD
ncbi:MAG: RsmD family RNA methyltransferase [Proteobacteria bacterium]|nr:RsmD family RNA methyltransferase [Pseudomonadota bacterium]